MWTFWAWNAGELQLLTCPINQFLRCRPSRCSRGIICCPVFQLYAVICHHMVSCSVICCHNVPAVILSYAFMWQINITQDEFNSIDHFLFFGIILSTYFLRTFIVSFQFIQLLNKHLSLKRIRSHINQAAWVTSEFLSCIDRKEYHSKLFRKMSM